MTVHTSKKRGLLSRVPTSTSLWNVVCFSLVVIVGVAYVMQVSSVTKSGYEMRDLEVAVGELELQNEHLSVDVAEATSLNTVSERMQILGFVESDDVVYLTGTSSVAVR